MRRAVGIAPDGLAGPRRDALHRGQEDTGVRAVVGRGHGLDSGAPHAGGFGQQQTLTVREAVRISAHGGAVPRRGARNRGQAGVRNHIRVARHLRLRPARPRPARLGQQESVRVGRAVAVDPDCGARPRRRTRHRFKQHPRIRSCVARRYRRNPRGPCSGGPTHEEPLKMHRAVLVISDGGAIAVCGTRHRRQADGRVRQGSAGKHHLESGGPRTRHLIE